MVKNIKREISQMVSMIWELNIYIYIYITNIDN